ncbi:hypothetical protein [Streptomyces parvulus]|uniref:hypothetical protein n=1 Tax=Streptomyces parvulus TaxID=146923 RepID=UPI0011C02EC7|nr:hypothetical protein [Streptomyces parvulus]
MPHSVVGGGWSIARHVLRSGSLPMLRSSRLRRRLRWRGGFSALAGCEDSLGIVNKATRASAVEVLR